MNKITQNYFKHSSSEKLKVHARATLLNSLSNSSLLNIAGMNVITGLIVVLLLVVLPLVALV